MDASERQRLIDLDRAHVWHPFTPMQQWREHDPLIIESAEGDHLIDADGNRYIDGVSSLWCNVHGHRVPEIDAAIRTQLDKVAHTTMLGLCNVPATELAAKLAKLAPGALNKVFYSDAGATATEVAFKMAVGYWHHTGQPQRHVFLAMSGAYHGDTVGAMSIGYSDVFHKPFKPLTFRTEFFAAPDTYHRPTDGPDSSGDVPDAADLALDALLDGVGMQDGTPGATGEGGKRVAPRAWSLEDSGRCADAVHRSLLDLDRQLEALGDTIAAIVVEPLVQGAAGMIMQPEGYLAMVADKARDHGTLLIADEVAVGFGRTGSMFACTQEGVKPDIMCLGKGLTGGYLPLAATLCTDRIEAAFCGELAEHRTLYHGHTYTGNPLAAAAALASLELFDRNNLLKQVNHKAAMLAERLNTLRDRAKFPHVGDVRQRGLMVGIELTQGTGDRGQETGNSATGFDPSRRLGYEVCDACRAHGVIIRPLGNVVVLMPPLAIAEDTLMQLADVVIEQIAALTP
ncbi:MAG: aminotransferase class III-fold pyridoxal phosphate-dependent enzyme [Phycisphaera sp.]|nr:aminotransferase class III-fold pyridoxal phosphate-dependent enzyme [Phycisphaera sp.]